MMEQAGSTNMQQQTISEAPEQQSILIPPEQQSLLKTPENQLELITMGRQLSSGSETMEDWSKLIAPEQQSILGTLEQPSILKTPEQQSILKTPEQQSWPITMGRQLSSGSETMEDWSKLIAPEQQSILGTLEQPSILKTPEQQPILKTPEQQSWPITMGRHLSSGSETMEERSKFVTPEQRSLLVTREQPSILKTPEQQSILKTPEQQSWPITMGRQLSSGSETMEDWSKLIAPEQQSILGTLEQPSILKTPEQQSILKTPEQQSWPITMGRQLSSGSETMEDWSKLIAPEQQSILGTLEQPSILKTPEQQPILKTPEQQSWPITMGRHLSSGSETMEERSKFVTPEQRSLLVTREQPSILKTPEQQSILKTPEQQSGSITMGRQLSSGSETMEERSKFRTPEQRSRLVTPEPWSGSGTLGPLSLGSETMDEMLKLMTPERLSIIAKGFSTFSDDDNMIKSQNGDISEGEAEDSCDEIRPHNIIADHHNDVLAKLKMQVRDIKEDFENRQMHFPLPNRTTSQDFPLGMAAFPFQHPGSFMPPLPQQQVTPSSASSHSSEGSVSSQQTWSFEEQFKQVRQLYEINDDPKRKEFLDDLFSFMQKRGTPINRLPIMAKSVLDLYELYNLVIARGGLVDVINKKLWQEIIKGLHLPSSITSAAFTLRTQYMKYLYPYECAKRHLSTPSELQAAIDGNRREGRRSSYGQYDQRSPNGPPGPALSPHQLASHQQLAARINSVMSSAVGLQNGSLHPSHPSPMGTPLNGCPVPGITTAELEARMLEYMKLINKEMRNNGLAGTPQDTPPLTTDLNLTPNLSQIDLSRLTLWNIYNNNQLHEPQKEALNLNLSETHIPSPHAIKREADSDLSPPAIKKSREDELVKNLHVPPSNAHFKIDSRGDSRNGDNSMVVSMEFNGVTYQGVLFPQPSPNGRSSLAS